MSLTQTSTVFAAIHENGLNDLIEAFYNARTHYFVYATPAFTSSTTASITSIPAISFPGIPGGIDFAIGLRQPTIDLHPDSSGGSAVLPPQAGQFTVSARVVLLVPCGDRQQDFDLTHGRKDRPIINASPQATELEIHARGSLINAAGNISFKAEEIEIVDIAPESLENVIECIMRLIVNAVLQNIRIPIPSLTLDAFSLSITDGPRIEEDQIKVWGTV